MAPAEQHPVVTRDEWLAARKQHLIREKELTRMRDDLSAERRALPWVRIDKAYTFHTPDGDKSLAQLFGDNSQLIVYHFMLATGKAEGCVGCSFLADHLEGTVVHLEHHDVSVVMVSRAPLVDIQRYRQRMQWNIPWVSSNGSDFNYDFHVAFTPEQVASGSVEYNYQTIEPWGPDAHGISVFFKDATGDVFHTYSSYGRGAEVVLGTYAILDMTPNGRAETGEDGDLSDWVKRHDSYAPVARQAKSCCTSTSENNLQRLEQT